jgi:hypothetical protein
VRCPTDAFIGASEESTINFGPENYKKMQAYAYLSTSTYPQTYTGFCGEQNHEI